MTPTGLHAFMQAHHHAGYRLGIIALLITLAVAAILPSEARLALIALLLALTAGIYMGFAWLDGRTPWLQVETLVGLALLATALLGLVLHPLFIAAGFLAHVPWDLLHHPRYVQTRIARWVPPACLLYDVGVAVAALVWWSPL